MPITSADCKKILEQDPLLLAAGATPGKPWKRLSKKKGPLGVERVFSHPVGLYARLVESGDILWIGAAATTMEELDDPINQRAVVAVAPAASAPNLWYLSAEATRSKAEAARKYVDQLLDRSDDGEHGDLYDAASKLDPIALANQYTFAIFGEGAFGACGACITPTSVWLNEQCCYDQGSPLEHLMPEGSEDLNECGTWMVGGYEEKTPLELATFLLSKGFLWDREFQDFIDTKAGEELEAIDQARQGPTHSV
jgi:hypothetical protein